jgi:hypothetical protein
MSMKAYLFFFDHPLNEMRICKLASLTGYGMEPINICASNKAKD